MMGVKHRKAVEAIPAGLMHPDEKSVLYAVATETNDQRLEWAHDRSKLLAILGLRNDRAGEKWLQRRLKALEDAGWIARKAQPRLDGGRWGWGLIRLAFREMGDSVSVDQHVDGFKPTPRADDARRPNHVFTPEERTRGYEHGIGRTGGQVESERVDRLRPPAAGLTESERVDELRPTSPDPPEIEPGPTRPLALDNSSAGLAIAIDEAREMKAQGVLVDGRPIESVEALGRAMYKDRPGLFDSMALKADQPEMTTDTRELIGDLVEAFGFEEAAG